MTVHAPAVDSTRPRHDWTVGEVEALCFLAGANSIFIGGRLLTTNNPEKSADEALLADLKMRPMRARVSELA